MSATLTLTERLAEIERLDTAYALTRLAFVAGRATFAEWSAARAAYNAAVDALD